MEILKNIEICELALFVKDKRILVIGDLHLGFEESLNKQGVMIPRFLFDDIVSILRKAISKTNPKKIVIVGDIKHEFGSISDQEWRHALRLIDFLREKAELTIIKGNHDPILFPIAEKRNHDIVLEPITKKRNVKVRTFYKEGSILFAHGDFVVNEKTDVIIIGHEHPAVSFKERPSQKYKCFLKGKYNKADLIVMPSFNTLVPGSDITKRDFLSPYLEKAKDIEVYIIEDKVYRFGKLNKLIF